jgi:hypothetical protein
MKEQHVLPLPESKLKELYIQQFTDAKKHFCIVMKLAE